MLSDSCLLGYFNDDGAGPSDATRTITQDHDGGAAAAAKVRQLGYEGLSVHPVGGARFTHWSRQLNFEWILCDLWKHQGARFSTVVVVWAGNDLKWWMTPEELENAISSVLHKVAGRASAH